MSTIRHELYNNVNVQFLITGFLERAISLITPSIDTGTIPRYLVVENVTNLAPEKARDLLESMAKASILKKELFAKTVSCPECSHNTRIYQRFECPRCSSIDISSLSINHDTKTGSTRTGSKTITNPTGSSGRQNRENKLLQCRKCSNVFAEPTSGFTCEECQTTFSYAESILHEAFSYELNDEIRQEIESSAYLHDMKNEFSKKGYETRVPEVVIGLSGVSHRFALSGRTKLENVLVDLAINTVRGEANELDVLAFYAKLIDVQPTSSLLVAVPSLNSEGREIAEANGVNYIQAQSLRDAVSALRELIQTPKV